jgi:multiple sugar transport system permease protein
MAQPTVAAPRIASGIKGWLLKPARREAISGYLFILPTFLGYTVFIIGPILAAIGLSFTQYDLLSSPTFTGLENYRQLASDTRLHLVYRNTIFFTVVSVFFNIGIGLLLAVLLNRKLPAFLRYFLRSAFFFPVLIGHVYIAIIWQFLYQQDTGVINYYLGLIGLGPYPWLSSGQWAMPSVIIMDVWKNTGFAMLVCLAGLQNVPQDYYEAAALDGAGAWTRFRSITLPLISPTLFFLSVIFAIGAIQVFDSIIVLTNGGPGDSTRSIVMYLREVAFDNFEMGYGSAVAITLFAAIMALTLVQFRVSRAWVHYE